MPMRYVKNKKIIIGILILLVIGIGLFFSEKSGLINVIDTPDKTATSSGVETTSKAPTAQSSFTDGDNRQPLPTSSNEGTVTDNNGSIASIPPENEWTTSKDAKITVYSPAKDSVVESGDRVTGTSTLERVAFRLIDDVTGVIAEGTIGVRNGKFSGTLNYTTTAETGRLDIYTTRSDGAESSVVEIPISYR